MSLRDIRSHHVVLALLLTVFAVGSALLSEVGASGFDQGAVPSTDNRAFGGLRGIYLTCESLGLEVEAWRHSTELLDDSVHALVAVETPQGRHAGGDLLEWTRGGGRLLVTSTGRLGPPWTSLGLNHRGIGAFRGVTFQGDAEDWCEPGALTSNAAGFQLPLPARARVLAIVGRGPNAAPWLVEIPEGEGTILALADGRLLTNDRLAEPDAAVAAVRLMAHLGAGEPVAFCETLHGDAPFADPTAAFLHMLGTTPLGKACIGASLFLVLFLIAGAPRFGRIRKHRETPRRSEHEYLEALGGLLQHERAWIDVGAFLREGLRRRMDPGGRTEGPPDDADIVRGLAWDRPEQKAALAADVEHLAAGSNPTAMLHAVRRLDAVLLEDRQHLGGKHR